MKRTWILLLGGLVAAWAAYGAFYRAHTASQRRLLAGGRPEMLWLKKEFGLSDTEVVRVTQLHEAYLPQCQARCERIAELNSRLAQAIGAASQLTPEIERVLAERARMRADCQAEMLKHFFEVSHTMPAEQGRRYLAWVQQRTCLNETPMYSRDAPRPGRSE